MAHSDERLIMEKRKIGSLGVSVVGLGCNNFGWNIDADETARVVDAAIAAGINFFDTADIYGKTQSEQFLGRALGRRRGEVIVATKFGMKVDEQRRGAKPAYVRQAAEDSLKRLGTDHIDLYQLHEPDSTTPIADTLGALDELVKAGKVREIGCSNFSAEQLRAAQAAVKQGASRFVSVQNEYNLLHRKPEGSGVLEECRRQNVAFIPFFPLASGLLTGKYRKDKPLPEGTRIQPGGRFDKLLTEENFDKVEGLIAFAQKRGHTLLELAFSWLAGRGTVASVIAGATSVNQVKSNAGAVDWKLTEEDLAEVDRILK
jgi:aryl-alcohol dehydrogenase-like predicted oxidoreductase